MVIFVSNAINALAWLTKEVGRVQILVDDGIIFMPGFKFLRYKMKFRNSVKWSLFSDAITNIVDLHVKHYVEIFFTRRIFLAILPPALIGENFIMLIFSRVKTLCRGYGDLYWSMESFLSNLSVICSWAWRNFSSRKHFYVYDNNAVS